MTIEDRIKALDAEPFNLKVWRLECENEILKNIIRQMKSRLDYHTKQHQGWKGAYKSKEKRENERSE